MATGTVSEDGCSLTLHSSTSYCTSDEEQCEKRDLTLQIGGDSASGTLDYVTCWCGDYTKDKTFTVNATAKRM